jgi:putative exosortase-associated protein (TIGR04073 family)
MNHNLSKLFQYFVFTPQNKYKKVCYTDNKQNYAGFDMTPTKTFLKTLLFLTLTLLLTPVFAVDYYQQQVQNEQLLQRQIKKQNEMRESMEGERYRRQVGEKALFGAANIVTSPLEIPKNIINLTNEPDSNIFYGIFGGIIRGSIDVAGRVTNGLADVVTAPLPTKRVVEPRLVWDDFDQYNTYGPVFRLVDNPKIEPYVAPPPRPVAVNKPIDDQTDRYNQETNRSLDTMFQHEMRK